MGNWNFDDPRKPSRLPMRPDSYTGVNYQRWANVGNSLRPIVGSAGSVTAISIDHTNIIKPDDPDSINLDVGLGPLNSRTSLLDNTGNAMGDMLWFHFGDGGYINSFDLPTIAVNIQDMIYNYTGTGNGGFLAFNAYVIGKDYDPTTLTWNNARDTMAFDLNGNETPFGYQFLRIGGGFAESGSSGSWTWSNSADSPNSRNIWFPMDGYNPLDALNILPVATGPAGLDNFTTFGVAGDIPKLVGQSIFFDQGNVAGSSATITNADVLDSSHLTIDIDTTLPFIPTAGGRAVYVNTIYGFAIGLVSITNYVEFEVPTVPYYGAGTMQALTTEPVFTPIFYSLFP